MTDQTKPSILIARTNSQEAILLVRGPVSGNVVLRKLLHAHLGRDSSDIIATEDSRVLEMLSSDLYQELDDAMNKIFSRTREAAEASRQYRRGIMCAKCHLVTWDPESRSPVAALRKIRNDGWRLVGSELLCPVDLPSGVESQEISFFNPAVQVAEDRQRVKVKVA